MWQNKEIVLKKGVLTLQNIKYVILDKVPQLL